MKRTYSDGLDDIAQQLQAVLDKENPGVVISPYFWRKKPRGLKKEPYYIQMNDTAYLVYVKPKDEPQADPKMMTIDLERKLIIAYQG